ncbi:hypothetical protein D3C78_1596770 [compost metagenome]
MVDMWPFEGDDIGDQAMLIVQLLIFTGADGGQTVPTKGFERLGDEFLRLLGIQPALDFM